MRKIREVYHKRMRDYYFNKSQRLVIQGKHNQFSKYTEKFLYHMNKEIAAQV